MIRRYLGLYLVLGVMLGCAIWLSFPAGKSVQPSPEVQTTSGSPQEGLSPILPLTPLAGLPPERVMLGEQIFRDKRLSADSSLACVSCHDLGRGGVDGRQFSVGIGGAIGGINAPSVFNSGFSFAQFWDGRAASLEEQAAGPIHNPLEMGSNWAQVLQRLGADAPLLERFANAYPDGLTADNIANPIATFERSLVNVNSRFDRYRRGERQVLTVLEIDGYRRFREFGCISCHQGVLVGGNMYQKFGVLGDYFADRTTTREDLGRYNVTKRDEDRHVFKVPSLRNVALTAPYFHDGAALTLEQAVTVMARYQLGRELSGEDIESIVAFLETLTGSLPEAAPR